MCCASKFIILLLLVVIKGVHSIDDCPDSSASTTYSKLKSSLLCDYDAYTRPVPDHRNTTPVSIYILLKYFEYDHTLSTLDIDAWMKLNWTDHHLTWNAKEHDGIESIFLDTYEIWTPDLSVYNRASQGDPAMMADTKCQVFNNGSVVCVFSIHVDSLCVPDLRYYPYDRQNCDLHIGSWTHKGQEVDFLITKGLLLFSTMEPNGEWEIENYVIKKYEYQYPFMAITFKMKRLHAAHTATVVIPCIVVIVLTLTSLSISPNDADRLILCYINLVVQFLQVEYLSWQIPLKGNQVPLLLVFARDSLLMAAFAIVFTCIFKNIMRRQTLPPLWLSSFVSFATCCVPGRYLFLDDNTARGVASARGEEDGIAIIESKKNSPDWEIFVKILDLLFLICYIILYFVMFVKYIP